jgi:hypothetical protein
VTTTRALDYELESIDGGPLTIGSQVRFVTSSSPTSGIIIDAANMAGRGAFTVLWALAPTFERFRINSSGSIGIGTLAPAFPLNVKAVR